MIQIPPYSSLTTDRSIDYPLTTSHLLYLNLKKKMINRTKRQALVWILLIASIQTTYSQTYMEIDENKLLLGGKPPLPALSPVPFSKLDTIFKAVKGEK